MARSTRVRLMLLGAGLLAVVPGRAMDLSHPVAVPAPVSDGVLQVGSRRLHLPAGSWVLTAHHVDETFGRMRGRELTGHGISVWAVLVEDGRLSALVWLSLPIEDYQHVHRIGHNTCTEADSIERLDLTKTLTQPECLGVYGHHDLAGPMSTRNPGTMAWLHDHHVPDPGPIVRFVYKIRTDGTYGDVMLVTPTAPFAADEEATRWARLLREACRPMFEGRATDCTVPPLPQPAAAAPGPVAASAPQ